MNCKIHQSAIIEKGAELDDNVNIGPYAYIGKDVKIGKDTSVMHHATVDGKTMLGEGNEIHPYAYIGGKTHDLKYEKGINALIIGKRNVFREYVTVHCATNENSITELKDDNVILAYSHIAHECKVGSNLIMSSHSALGGHVIVGDNVNIGWGVGVHQFCRIGDYAMAAATSTILQDIPPYLIAKGNPAKACTINRVGLDRGGYSKESISCLKSIYILFYKKGLNNSQAIDQLAKLQEFNNVEARNFVDFIKSSKRGII